MVLLSTNMMVSQTPHKYDGVPDTCCLYDFLKNLTWCSFQRSGDNSICIFALLGRVPPCAIAAWLSCELCFPDICFLYDSRTGLANKGTYPKFRRWK